MIKNKDDIIIKTDETKNNKNDIINLDDSILPLINYILLYIRFVSLLLQYYVTFTQTILINLCDYAITLNKIRLLISHVVLKRLVIRRDEVMAAPLEHVAAPSLGDFVHPAVSDVANKGIPGETTARIKHFGGYPLSTGGRCFQRLPNLFNNETD